MKTYVLLRSDIAQCFLETEMFQNKVVEKIKMHILCSITFSEKGAVYEIMWKNMLQPDRPHVTI
jgi:hypothetical protein